MYTATGLLCETHVDRITTGARDERCDDVLAVEEPLEIRLGIPGKEHKAISITMRTPGDDFALAAGFLFTEGILTSSNQIKRIIYCGRKSERPASTADGFFPRLMTANDAQTETPSNTVRVDLHETIDTDLKRLERNFYTTSSCGVCGKSSIEALQTGAKKLTDSTVVNTDVIHRLPASLLNAQFAFEKTGGLHASALFDTNGNLDSAREDVGRHNALDKVIGNKFLNGALPLLDKILLVSGRASFELVQKALMAGIPILAAVGAPSSLAVQLAKEFNMTLIGFVRDDRFNIYSGRERVRQ